MANMRVHELAKELNISSKDITDMLSSNEKKYTAMSGLGENEINNVKSRFKAKAVADKMKLIAKNHQIICITHLATIAAKGDYNYYIFKQINNGKTTTNVELLNKY